MVKSFEVVRKHRRLSTSLGFGFVLSAMLAVAQAQVVEDWVRRYDSGGSDVAHAVAVDGAGNLYVTGSNCDSDALECDYATVKYDAEGNELWVSRYHYGTYDMPYASAVDGAGNVYVTGISEDPVTGHDYATIKYDTEGNELWVRRYDNGGYSGDQARALVVDGAGNVYVTGSSDDRDTLSDYATIKYNSEGDELWVRRYDNGMFDDAFALAVDAAGGVYVTGHSFNPFGWSDRDYATVKYDAEGNELWVSRYHYGTYDMASALAVDGAGNVYVTGGSSGDTSISSHDCTTVKYDPDGNELWVRRYDNDGLYDGAIEMALDGAGNVYVTGASVDSVTGIDYATIKYDAEGNELWVSRYDHQGLNDHVMALAMDAAGNVYLTGSSEDSVTGTDYATVKYNSEGDELWVRRYDNGMFDDAFALAVDAAGGVYVTGFSYDGEPNGHDYTTIKYVQTLRPAEMMANAIAFYQEALEEDTIVGLGKGSATTAHEQVFGRMLDAIYDLILAEDFEKACRRLDQALLQIDGTEPPPDLVGGSAAPPLQEMLLDVYSALGG